MNAATDTPAVYRFNRAIVRQPGTSVGDGIRLVDRGTPAYDDVRSEHSAYVAALQAVGVDVTVLPPLDNLADSLFVEDPALVFTNGAIVLRSAVPARAAEAAFLTLELQECFPRVLYLPEPGCADGGDVLVTPTQVLIGLSARTDRHGAAGLEACLNELGYDTAIVQTPTDVLHLKSDCSLLDDETVLSTHRLARSGIFSDYKVIETPAGEEAAANALRVNDVVLVADGFPATIKLLQQGGFDVCPLPTSAIGLLDAGLSCMSLRWHSM
ncbi:MAG: dimethylarginine dimethylaminohydrolase [Gammaproteobacteria bacterium]|nr:dimethylarginine dimethylaminohydrolase [Gammaproteobacteria bacterium]